MDQELIEAIEQHRNAFDEFEINIVTLPLTDPDFRNRLLQQIRDCIAVGEPIRPEMVGLDSYVPMDVDI